MKKISRFIRGLVTSLLLSIGLVRAAELSAPSLQTHVVSAGDRAALGCEMPCVSCSSVCDPL